MPTFKCHALYILALMFHHLSTFATKLSMKCQNAAEEENKKRLARDHIKAVVAESEK